MKRLWAVVAPLIVLSVAGSSPIDEIGIPREYGDNDDRRRSIDLTVSPEEDSYLDPGVLTLSADLTDDTTVDTKSEHEVSFLVNYLVVMKKMTKNLTVTTTFDPRTMKNENGKIFKSLAGSTPGTLRLQAKASGFPDSKVVEVRIVDVRFERNGKPVTSVEVGVGRSEFMNARAIPPEAQTVTLTPSGFITLAGSTPGPISIRATKSASTGAVQAKLSNGKACGKLDVKTTSNALGIQIYLAP